ncbi:hypothetical protein CTI12_AA407860 [Artemisia annua]|uniref:SWIM-type domain-containing protein n=1 Tax=Artemisia annua TaxID=35608 RepID=A0A2U1L3S6_ARTAN|nr:hypothetical protein CTI12_AA407860 [Artemisia annua]
MDRAVRLKSIEEGYQFLVRKSDPDSEKLKHARRDLKPKDMQRDMLEQYKTSISYQQAWRGKDYGLQMIRGSPTESFEMLPYYCHNLEKKPMHHHTYQDKRSRSIRDVIRCHWCFNLNFRATSSTAAYSRWSTFEGCIQRGETCDCWSWWFSCLKECIGDSQDLVIIFDRHPSIALADTTKALYWRICKAYTPDEFDSKMQMLLNIQPEAYHKLVEAGVQRWSRAYCPLTCYNYCTSNSVESVNACIVKSRKLPITMLTEQYRKMVQDWYFKRRQVAARMKYEITDWAAHKVEKRKIKSATWNVYGVMQHRFQVFDGRYNREVNLTNGTCDCRKWQLFGIPCRHVIVVSRFLGQTDYVQFVHDWFKKPKYQATYAEAVNFVGEFHEWEYPTHIKPITPPQMDNPQPGRPKNTDRIRSQGEEQRVRHCSRCGEAGHDTNVDNANNHSSLMKC